jgi:hypothetical protein
MTTTIEITVPKQPLSKGEQEYAAFLRLLPTLLGQYQGKYVAIHEEQVIDSDADDITLIQRVHARIGYVPIHVGLVCEQRPLIRLPHYREYKPSHTP